VTGLIEQLKTKNPDLKKAEIEGLLYLLLSEKALTNNELVTKTGLPKETVREFIKGTANMLEKSDSENLKLSSTGHDSISATRPQPYKWSLLQYDTNKALELEKKFREISENIVVIPKREYDQFIATVHTSVSKALIMEDRGAVKGKKIALLGDDDLLSVSLSLLGGYSELEVLDVDPDVNTSVKGISKSLGISDIQTATVDLRKRINPQLEGKFDVVVADPPYTKSGILLFINRAVQLLGKTNDFEGKYLFLYYGNSFKTPEKTLKIQDIIGKFNLLIEDKLDKFARYTGAESIGNASSLYILKTTKHTKALDEAALSLPIYTYENQKEEKFPYVSHYTAKIYGVPKNIINSRSYLLRFLGQFCELHKLKVIDKKETKFKGIGYSFTFILGSSNLLAHTWPEYSAIHLDLVTCTPVYNKEALGSNLQSLFKAKNVEIREVE
jgi:predicted methyltransferase